MSSIKRPVCPACKREMVCTKTGIQVVGHGSVFSGDKYSCTECGNEVVVDFGKGCPAHEHPELVKKAKDPIIGFTLKEGE